MKVYIVMDDCIDYESGGGYFEVCEVFSDKYKAIDFIERMESIAKDTDVYCNYHVIDKVVK